MESTKDLEAVARTEGESTVDSARQNGKDAEAANEDKESIQCKDDSPAKGEVGLRLTDIVDASLLSQLQEMGFSEARAGRALLAIRGSSSPATVEAALSWIESHEDEEEMDEPITNEELAAHKPTEKTPLSEEEAQRRAYELQKRLREERIKREKQEAIDRERLRLQQAKAMLEQNAKLEEEARKRAISQLQKEKEEAKKERERQRELLRQDYRDRFGCEMPEDSSQAPEERVAKMSGKEKVAYFCNTLFQRYKKEDPQKLMVCLSTLRVYAVNAKDNPNESKYHRIRKENAAFKTRVLPYEGVLELLDACGFKDKGEVLEIEGQPDGFVLAQAVKFLDLLIGKLKS